jgi:hypothetical protein
MEVSWSPLKKVTLPSFNCAFTLWPPVTYLFRLMSSLRAMHVNATNICEERVGQQSRDERARVGDLRTVHCTIDHMVLQDSGKKVNVRRKACQGSVANASKGRV